jgi:hypothetical protein
MVSFYFVCPCYILAKETGNDVMSIARTARAALTKSSPVSIWLYYFEKCSGTVALHFLPGVCTNRLAIQKKSGQVFQPARFL